jgi:hypothetical protein
VDGMTYDIVPTDLAVAAMRDSGYRNAAYAIAELVDNAVQAGAHAVEIVCKEDEVLVQQRTRRRVKQIAVIDNGSGMKSEVLRKALQFGNGERLGDRSGIGRFGMGLPNSSISQARRVDVWTWQGGAGKALHSYLDLDEIAKGTAREVPEPSVSRIPPEWLRLSRTAAASDSGTLVVWSNLDKCDWRTAHAIFKNSEFTIGRIYRRMLVSGAVSLRMAAFVEGASEVDFDEEVRPNDPLYLMRDTSCPDPWQREPMFSAYGEPHVIPVTTADGVTHSVSVRYSMAKPEARQRSQGRTAHGQHAKGNMGVSVVRADRELELQTGWCVGYDPRERWWGVEVEFPPALDEVFGVTNNKQSARALAEFAVLDLEQVAAREGYSSEQELMEAWREDRDLRMALVQVKNSIESNLAVIRKSINAQAERERGGRGRHKLDSDSAEVRGTLATQNRQREGHQGTSDADESLPMERKREGIASTLEAEGLDKGEAEQRAQGVVDDGRKFEFYEVSLVTPEFFTVRAKAGAILIGLNTDHPAYQHLVTLMRSSDDTDDVQQLKGRLSEAYEGLKLLLEAWARYEDELTDGRRKEQAQEARLDWGRVARDFFRDE